MADQRHFRVECTAAGVPRLEITCSPAARVCRALGAPSRVTIGSSSVSDFRIVSRGVRARHVVIDWDGRALVIVEINGPVLVNGRSVEAPFPIVGEACLLVGDAAIWVAVPALADDPPTLLSANEAPTVPNAPTHSVAPASVMDVRSAGRGSGLIIAGIRAARDSLARVSPGHVPLFVAVLFVAVTLAVAAWRLRSPLLR